MWEVVFGVGGAVEFHGVDVGGLGGVVGCVEGYFFAVREVEGYFFEEG